MNSLMFKLVLEKAEEPEIKLPTSAGSSKKQESSRKTFYFSILKSRDITLPTKVPLVKAMVYPVAVYGCESWTFAFNFPSFSEEERRES